SVIGFSFNLDSQTSQDVDYWICAGETLREVQALQSYCTLKTPNHLIETTGDFWKAWVNKKNFSFHGLDETIVSLFKKSLLIIRTHCDNRGGILASGDSDNFQYGRDTYGYIWPRDAALVAQTLDRAGYHETSKKFYRFCNEIITPDGYVLHKYQADKSLGSSWHPWIKDGKKQLAIQEDETALILCGLWEHYKQSLGLEFIEEIYNSLIKNAADFLVRFRNEKNGLPQPSYDLWEEKYGVSIFTVSSVIGALRAAANFAELLGKEEDTAVYTEAGEKLKNILITDLYNKEKGVFYKMAFVEKDRITYDQTIDASSFLGPFRFNVLRPEDEKIQQAYEKTKKVLATSPFGIARYENDQYFRSKTDKTSVGNPWFITTLWFIQYDISRAKTSDDLASVSRDIAKLMKFAQPSGVLSEQVSPESGLQVSVSPLIWSHSEFVLTTIMYMEKAQELAIAPVCYPLV
ncbi:MAG: hypothetical protein RJA61_1, partial [Candidatus Parcubacteria bacterium]